MTANNQREQDDRRLFLIGFTQTHHHPSLKKIAGDVQRKTTSHLTNPTYMCCMERVRWRMISGRESGGRERNQRACSNSFGVSLAKERETDGETWRWKERQQNKKNQGTFKWKKNKDVCVKSISISSSSSPATTLSTHVFYCVLLVTSWRNLKLGWSLYKRCTSVTVLLQLFVEYR